MTILAVGVGAAKITAKQDLTTQLDRLVQAINGLAAKIEQLGGSK